jgi:peroxiredoxin
MPAQPVRAAVGSAAPDLLLQGRDGEARLSDYWARQPVLLVFMRAFG